MIIGVDHGYGLMKTTHYAFPTGIARYEHEPYSLRNTLKVNDKYYVCGSGRQSLMSNLRNRVTEIFSTDIVYA